MKEIDAIILSCFGYELTLNEKNFFKNINPLGFVLFKRNFKNKKQIKLLIRNLRKATLNKDLLIFIDQEGGRVQRLDNYEFTKFPPQMTFGNIYKKNKKKALELAYKSANLMGKQLNEICVDVNFSPVCDLFFDNAHNIIGDRSFGSDPELVMNLSHSFCKGLKDSGIIPVPKHFPGHGRSKFDTHMQASSINKSYKDLIKTDLVPFKILDNCLMVMLAHIKYPLIDSKVATYSNEIINNILRKKFNFRGLVISDDISMKALKEDLQTKVVNCYKGGCDVVMYCKGNLNDMKLIYPFVNILEKKRMNLFFSEKKKITVKRKNSNKFKSDLIEYNLINNASKS